MSSQLSEAAALNRAGHRKTRVWRVQSQRFTKLLIVRLRLCWTFLPQRVSECLYRLLRIRNQGRCEFFATFHFVLYTEILL